MQDLFAVTNPNAKTNLIIVMGVSGSGKTSIARVLAKHYGYDFLDADDFHSQESRELMARGIPLTDAMRLPWVVRISDHLRNAAQQEQHTTLAFSGLRHTHRDELRKAGLKTLFLFLHGDKGIIQNRVNQRADHFMAPSLIDSQFDSLEKPCHEADIYPIDINNSLGQITTQAIGIINHQLFGAPPPHRK